MNYDQIQGSMPKPILKNKNHRGIDSAKDSKYLASLAIIEVLAIGHP